MYPSNQPPSNLLNLIEIPSTTQLPLPHPSTHPGARQRSHNQRQRIPMRPKRRPLVPRYNRPRNTHNKTDKPGDQGMPHWAIRSKPSRNIAAHNAEDDPIRGSQHKRPITHRLPPRRKHADSMQHQVADERQHNTHHNPGNHSPNAPANTSGRTHSPSMNRRIHPPCHNSPLFHPLFEQPLLTPRVVLLQIAILQVDKRTFHPGSSQADTFLAIKGSASRSTSLRRLNTRLCATLHG
jgi:hypothetical protein